VHVFFTDEAYFTANPTVTSWSEVPETERDRLTGLALRGTTRALTAFGLSVPALLERMLHLLLTVNVAMLALSLILIVPFIVLDSYAALALDLLRQLPQLVVVSTLIAIGQAIVSAFLLIVARSGNAWVVMIAAVVYGVMVALAVVVLAWQALRALMALASTALTGGVGAAQDVGRIALGGMVGAIGGTFAGGRALLRPNHAAPEHRDRPRLADSVNTTVGAYHAARAAGHNRNFAAGYALSGSHLGQTAARAGLASGVVGGPHAPEIERGLRRGVIMGQGEPMSLPSILKMRQMPKRPPSNVPRVSPGQAVGARYAQDIVPPLLTQGPLITPAPAPAAPRGARVYQTPPPKQ
jgi:hypothetical protein